MDIVGLFHTITQYFYAPNSDFFLYLSEGKLLARNPFTRIVIPPLYPLIVYFFEKLLPIRNPGVVGGALFNVVCFVLTLYFMWKMAKRWLGWYALIPIIWMFISPLTYPVILQTTNIPLGLLLIILSLSYHEERPAFSYVLALLAFLTRTESIALFGVFFFYDFVRWRRIKNFILFIVCFVAACFVGWLILLPKDIIFDYTKEILARKAEIPNMLYITNSFFILPLFIINKAQASFVLFSDVSYFTAGSILWLVVGARYFYKNRYYEPLMLLGYIVIYSFIHMFFPDTVYRYSYLILPFVFILFCWPAMALIRSKSYFLKTCIILGLIGTTGVIAYFFYTNGLPWINRERLIDSEKRLTAEWFNEYIHEPSAIYVFEAYVYRYFSKNKNIIYPEAVSALNWTVDFCFNNKRTYVVLDNKSTNNGGYWDHVHGLALFHLIAKSPEIKQTLSIVHTITIGNHWATIYSVDKAAWCSNFSIIDSFFRYK